MQLDEEFPESLEELEKEIEELEKTEIVPPEEVPKKKVKREVPTERKFRFSSVFVGFLILFAYFFALTYVAIDKLITELHITEITQSEHFVISAIFPLTAIPTIPNVMLLIVTDQLSLIITSIDSATASVELTLLVGWLLVFVYSLVISSDIYILLFVVGIMPYLLAGFAAGALNKDPGYGFVAGLFIWILSLIVAVVLMNIMITQLFGELLSITDILIGYISTGYLSAIFLVIFGVLGGAMRGQE